MTDFPEEGSLDMWQAGGPVVPSAMPWFPMAPFWPAPAKGSKRWQAGQHHQHQQKQRFCATFPSVGRCRHGAACAFAHSREEITAPLLSPAEEAYAEDALTEEFFTQRFKTLWCPIGAQHDWHSCMYAHTYQDARRPPSIGYGHQLCPYWNKKDTSLAYAQRCPLGPRCPHAHGAKEQLYHPHYFRTLVCRDLQRRRCPRADLCAFFHKQGDCRKAGADPVDYSTPLPKENMPSEWMNYFMSPPRFQEASGEDSAAAALLPPALGGREALPMYSGKAAARTAHAKWAAAAAAGHEEDDGTTEGESGGAAEGSEESLEEAAYPGLKDLYGLGLGGHDDGGAAAAWLAAAAMHDEMAWNSMPYYSPYAGMYQGSAGCYMDGSGVYA